ncbi:tetratricopeptide repeat protein [Amycolatopsis solani]|uniref:tetratricopeptide repeat protein n=1 Tax=Amycolatopsis solani TaxID=3028615 RepID=UPI0025B075B6|nr:tetratricopeptide repeat protein [Amycolatopsis sp. MEP2-6]
MQRVNAGRRVGWLLRTNRVLGGRSRYRKLAAFAADFDADGVTPSVSVSTLSRWENRVTTVPGAAVRRYERMLDLRPGLLVAVNDTVARYLTPPTQTVPPWARHRRPNPGAPLDELIDLAVTDAVLGSEEWDRLTELLACRPQLVLSPASTWLRLSERLLTEMCIADGVSWMRRAEAFHRLIVHPVGQRAAMATAAAAAADTSAQSLIGTLGVFSASAHPDASSSVVRHLTDPLTDRTFYGALLTSVKKLRFGHFDDRQTASLLPILCALVASGGGERTPLAARLLQLLPRELQAKVPSRVWAAAMAALWPAAAPVSERLAAEALEGIEEPPPDPLLAVFIDEMLHDPVFDVRLCTMFLLYATPYRAPLAHALARELAGGDPLAGLSVDGAEESAVTTAFSVSYRALPAEHRLLFRRLALVPGQTFTAPVAAEIAGVTESHASRLLKALAAAHLVERHLPGRYRFHDLLRSYAATRSAADDPPADRDAARRRLFDHYLATADAAGRVLIPHFLRLPRAAPAPVFDGTEAALDWLDTEWPNLAAAVEHPEAREYAWHLADALRAFFHHRGHHAEWLETATTALAAAQAAGARQAQAAMRLSIALAGVNSGRYADARAHLTTVLHDGLAADWPAGRAAVLNNLSAVHQRLGDPHEAIACGLESLRLCEELGIPGVTMALANVGFACGQVGDLDEALRHFGRALEIAERDGARFSVAVVLVDLGHVYRDLGDPVAASFYERALTANRELGYQYGEAAALSGRAVLESRAGDATRALTDAADAVELTRRIGDRGTEASALAALGETCLRLNRPSEAVQPLSAALEIARETSFTWCEAAALTGLAEAALALGDAEEARTHGEAAAKLAAQSGYRPLETRAARTLDEGAG